MDYRPLLLFLKTFRCFDRRPQGKVVLRIMIARRRSRVYQTAIDVVVEDVTGVFFVGVAVVVEDVDVVSAGAWRVECAVDDCNRFAECLLTVHIESLYCGIHLLRVDGMRRIVILLQRVLSVERIRSFVIGSVSLLALTITLHSFTTIAS